MEQPALASVIVPVCNASSNLLVRSLSSVDAQTYGPVEIVLCTDDGIDRHALQGRHPNLRIESTRQVGSGPAAARNLGLQKAAGEYVCFLEVGDVFAPDKLKTLIPMAYMAGVAFDNSVCFDDQQPGCIERLSSRSQSGRCDLAFCKAIHKPVWPVFKRRIIEDLQFDEDLRWAWGRLFHLQAFHESGGIMFHGDPLHCSRGPDPVPGDGFARSIIAERDYQIIFDKIAKNNLRFSSAIQPIFAAEYAINSRYKSFFNHASLALDVLGVIRELATR